MDSAAESAPFLGQTATWEWHAVARSDRRATWTDAIARSYAYFDLGPPGESFSGRIASRNVAGMSLVACSSAACRGERSARIVRAAEERRFGIQVVLAGEERMACGDMTVALSAGSVVVWDSAQPSSFEVPTGLTKATVVFPSALLAERLPRNVPLAGTLVDGDANVGAVLRSHVTTLVAQRDSFDADDVALRNVTLDLLTAALLRQSGAREPDDLAASRRRLERIQAFMLARIADPELVPATIAIANGISLRYLHLLFHASGTTVAAWLKEQRLLRCRDELAARARCAESVGDVAYRFGLCDPSNFSRDFKRRFGIGPNAFRLNHRPRTPR